MITTLDDLAQVRTTNTGKRLVLTSGTFDLFHVGHLNYLTAVKQHGDTLIVLLSGDARVQARKGPTRPVIPEADRAQILDALKIVDGVLIDPTTPNTPETETFCADVVRLLQPDMYVTDGPDSRFIELLDADRFVILPRADGGQHASTSEIIAYIQKLPRD